jgi:NAD(P)-dependent dehydrogenase (short-subunit alcohol dehydrogenase family)
MANLFDLTGQTAVVTGSAQGMGRAMAVALAARTKLYDHTGDEITLYEVERISI